MDKKRLEAKLVRVTEEAKLLRACIAFDSLKLRLCENEEQKVNFKSMGMKYTGAYIFAFKNSRNKKNGLKNEAQRYRVMSDVITKFKEIYETEFEVDVGIVYLSSRIKMNVSVRSQENKKDNAVLRGGISLTQGRQIMNDEREFFKHYNAALSRDGVRKESIEVKV